MLENQENQIRLIRQDLEKIIEYKTRGAILRSKSQYEMLGECPSKYFLNLEKRNFTKKTIHRLQTEESEIISD